MEGGGGYNPESTMSWGGLKHSDALALKNTARNNKLWMELSSPAVQMANIMSYNIDIHITLLRL